MVARQLRARGIARRTRARRDGARPARAVRSRGTRGARVRRRCASDRLGPDDLAAVHGRAHLQRARASRRRARARRRHRFRLPGRGARRARGRGALDRADPRARRAGARHARRRRLRRTRPRARRRRDARAPGARALRRDRRRRRGAGSPALALRPAHAARPARRPGRRLAGPDSWSWSSNRPKAPQSPAPSHVASFRSSAPRASPPPEICDASAWSGRMEPWGLSLQWRHCSSRCGIAGAGSVSRWTR